MRAPPRSEKVGQVRLARAGGYGFTPVVVESYDRQCAAIHTLLNLLGRLAVDSGRVRKRVCVEVPV